MEYSLVTTQNDLDGTKIGNKGCRMLSMIEFSSLKWINVVKDLYSLLIAR